MKQKWDKWTVIPELEPQVSISKVAALFLPRLPPITMFDKHQSSDPTLWKIGKKKTLID